MKKAIVTGCPGQDASYLSELLLDKGYEVYGVSRRSTRSNDNMKYAERHENYKSVTLDITDASGVQKLVSDVKPDEYYNLAAMSHVGQSFKEPQSTLLIDGYSVACALDSILHHAPHCKFYQASTSELFGNVEEGERLSESSALKPRSPYAAAKLYAHHMVSVYRDAYNLHASCGILFNHESPRRGLNFVTRKMTDGIARIKSGFTDHIQLGNLDAIRDWGHAEDYVLGMWMMLQQEKPDDYVLATGQTASVREALMYLCKISGLDFDNVYRVNEEFMRPAEVPYLCGDPTKAKNILGWESKKTWMELLREMYEHDLNTHMRDVYLYR